MFLFNLFQSEIQKSESCDASLLPLEYVILLSKTPAENTYFAPCSTATNACYYTLIHCIKLGSSYLFAKKIKLLLNAFSDFNLLICFLFCFVFHFALLCCDVWLNCRVFKCTLPKLFWSTYQKNRSPQKVHCIADILAICDEFINEKVKLLVI